MTTPPPRRVADLARRGIRLVAAGALALLVTAVTAVATPGSRVAAAVQLVVGAVLVAAGVWRDRGLRREAAPHAERQDRLPSALGTTTIVAGLALVAVGAQAAIHPEGAQLDRFLLGVGAAFLAAGYVLSERRLVTLGLVQWMIVLALPASNTQRFAHCIIGPEFSVPVPQLDPVLLLAVGALVVGTVHRTARWRVQAGRGLEITGVITVNSVLLFKAIELPGLERLCGAGDALDEWWTVIGMVVAIASGLYGLVSRDSVWAATGVAALTAQGLVATTLTGEPWWALAALLPLVAGMAAAERAGVPWPREPGYGSRPNTGDLFQDDP